MIAFRTKNAIFLDVNKKTTGPQRQTQVVYIFKNSYQLGAALNL